MGRYLTADPVGHAGGINLFTYVDNDPISYMDPHGLSKVGGGLTRWGYSIPQISPVVLET